MEENKKDMDNSFKRLHSYESAVPDKLWDTLNEKRAPFGRKLPWLFWLSLFSTAVAGVLAWYYWQGPDKAAFPLANEHHVIARQTQGEEASSATFSGSERESSEQKVENLSKEKSKSAFSNGNQKAVPLTIKARTIPENSIAVGARTSAGEGGQIALNSPKDVPVEAEQSEGLPSAMANVPSLPALSAKPINGEGSADLRLPDPSCFDFGKSGPLLKALYFDVLAGPEFAFRSLSLKDPSQSESEYYLTARDTTERSWYAFSAQVRASMRYQSGLAVRAGVNYTQINEIFEYTNSREVRTTIIDIFDANGNIIRKDTLQEVGRRYKKTYNQYQFIDVPLMLGYEWDRQKWTMSVNAGAVFNFSFKQKGDIFSEQLEPRTITTGATNRYDVFETRAGISFAGSVGFGYEIAPNFQLLFEPHVRYRPSSIVKQTLDQKYLNIGLFAGLRYYFVCRK